MSRFDHIVVGGGVAGMTAAILLAKAGDSVALIEAFPLLAPTIRGFKRGGVQFDTGLHYVGGLGDGHPLDIYFKHLGIADSIVKKPYNHDGFDRFIIEKSSEEFTIPCGFDEMERRLKAWFPQDQKAVSCYVTAIKNAMKGSPFLNFSMDFDLEAAFHDESVTLQNFLDNLTDNDKLKAVLSYPNILYGVPPTEALLTTHALVTGSYILSAHTIEGGGLALTQAYERKLKELGISIRCNRRVESIDINDNREVQGVTLDNEEFLETPSCIWAAHPQSLISATPDSAFRPAFKKRLAALKDTTSALVLFGVSDTPIDMLDGQSIVSWPGTSFKKNLNGNVTPAESILYISSAHDPQSGKTAVTAIMPGRFNTFDSWAESSRTKRPAEYKEYKKNVLAEMEQEVFNRFPELQKEVSFIDGATPLTFRDYCATPTGSLYGLRHSNDQFNPAPVTKAKGLTLAGQSIVAPGILGAVISAYLTCGIILGHDVLHNELRELA